MDRQKQVLAAILSKMEASEETREIKMPAETSSESPTSGWRRTWRWVTRDHDCDYVEVWAGKEEPRLTEDRVWMQQGGKGFLIPVEEFRKMSDGEVPVDRAVKVEFRITMLAEG